MGLKEKKIRYKKHPQPTKSVWLIVCEGKNKTEKTYFDNLNGLLRNSNVRLLPKPCEDTSPEGMVKKALELADNYSISPADNPNDRIICLMDSDLSEDRFDKFAKLKADNPHIEIFVSTPCFEIWFLLHFEQFPKRYTSSQKTKTGLKKYIKDYSESMDVYNKIKEIRDNMQEAISNAQTLRVNLKNKDIDIYSIDANPYTDVDTLIKDILNLKA